MNPQEHVGVVRTESQVGQGMGSVRVCGVSVIRSSFLFCTIACFHEMLSISV